jgi:quercetin dioxygenase-like cupin family protein
MLRQNLKATLARLNAKRGAEIARHYHDNEEYMWVLSGTMKYSFDDREVELNAGETLIVPPNIPHSILVTEKLNLLPSSHQGGTTGYAGRINICADEE